VCNLDAFLIYQLLSVFQRRYYAELLPAVFASLQELDERRIGAQRRLVLRSVAAESDVAPIVGQCLDGMTKWAEEIDEKEVRSQPISANFIFFVPKKWADLSLI